MTYINKRNFGFTLVELIIIIAIIGIIAAFAIPRFTDLTSSSRAATRTGLLVTIKSSIGVAASQWESQGKTGTVTLQGSSTAITMNAVGYPDVGGTYSSTTCLTLLNSLITNVSPTMTATFTPASGPFAPICAFSDTAIWTIGAVVSIKITSVNVV